MVWHSVHVSWMGGFVVVGVVGAAASSAVGHGVC